MSHISYKKCKINKIPNSYEHCTNPVQPMIFAVLKNPKLYTF